MRGRLSGYVRDSSWGAFYGVVTDAVTRGDMDSALIMGGTTAAFRMAARFMADDSQANWDAVRAGKTGVIIGGIAAATYHFWVKHP